jgi:hypothetical protein
MCRQGVFVENPHRFPQFPTLEGDLNPNHPQYRQVTAQRRQIRKWKMKNKRNDEAKNTKAELINGATNKKELRRIKNRESAALSRKRKLAEVEEAKLTIESLNQENVCLRQRLLDLEQAINNFKSLRSNSLHGQQFAPVKSEPTFYCQSQPQEHEVPIEHHYHQQQQSYGMKPYQDFSNFTLIHQPKTVPVLYHDSAMLLNNDQLDPFGLEEFNRAEFDDLLDSPRLDFTNW